MSSDIRLPAWQDFLPPGGPPLVTVDFNPESAGERVAPNEVQLATLRHLASIQADLRVVVEEVHHAVDHLRTEAPDGVDVLARLLRAPREELFERARVLGELLRGDLTDLRDAEAAQELVERSLDK